MNSQIQGVICLCGNDGTGKSTLAKLIPSLFPQLHAIERSYPQTSPSFEALRKEIKNIDRLTYRYSFETQREEFEPSSSVLTEEGITLPVYWIMLHLDPSVIFQRIAEREEMGIYESKKCVEYYSYVYLELAAYYGMTVVDVNGSAQENATKIAQIIISGAGEQIKKVNLKKLTLQTIDSLNVQSQIISQLNEDLVRHIIFDKWLKQIEADQCLREFYFPELPTMIGEQGDINWKLCYLVAARWIITNHIISKNNNGQLSISLQVGSKTNEILLNSPSFLYFTEGESKLIFQIISKNQHVSAHFKSKIWILLKSTIYSHTKQHTGEIESLGKIRAVGSTLFLEMLRRNNLKHAYVAINRDGIIYSNKIQTNNVEIVFKKQFVGTDKHSYFMMQEYKNIVDAGNRYKNGIYVRFDWRNPNHYLKNHPKHILNLYPFYYIVEKSLGKEQFFNVFLTSKKVLPLGDKCVSQDVISNYMETGKVKKAVLSLYCAFSYYCKRVGLEIIDGCFMLDSQGDTVWSEINPDCMRVKKNELDSRVNYDKDIWRIGGSASKAQILEKWTLFNKLFIDYFTNNRFHQTELLQTTPLFYPQSQEALRLLKDNSDSLSQQYRQALKEIAHCTQKQKEIIATIDISEGKPTLVKSSDISEHHSENSLGYAHNYINVLPKAVLVDLDSAMGKQINNRKEIKSLCIKSYNNIYGVGGGIRSKQILSYYLHQLLVPKVIISTNLELLKELSKEEIASRIIVELSINEQNQVLTHGRKVNTHENVIKKMVELSKLGVRVVSLTFNQKEGHLSGIPRDQFRDIMFTVPGSIKKVIIAGGITSLSDLQYIWGFPKAVPQLGSALWKNKISIENIYQQIINYNTEGLCPVIITDNSEKLLGQVFMNQQAIEKTIQTRQLYRYSRKLGRLIKKGEQSGNSQKVVAIRLDCDNDCLNIIVQESIKPFCHNKCQSCFDFECLHKTQNMISLQNHLLRKKETGSGYSKRMQQNEHLALSKFIEESYEFSLTKTKIVEEGADVISHMLMYLNAKGIPFQNIMKELEVRSVQVKPKNESIVSNEDKKVVYMGVMGGKHYEKIDKAMLNSLGIKVIRPTNRSLKLTYVIEDQQKYDKFFKGLNLSLIGIKSKDMQQFLNKQFISFCFNYSIMMENTPKVWIEHFKEPISEIKLVLLERKGEKSVNPYQWTAKNKGRIASEYPRSVANYFEEIGVDESCYSIIQVSGGTESYLQIDSFDYCDAIVESGRTIEDNNLRIVKILAPQIQAAMYTLVE